MHACMHAKLNSDQCHMYGKQAAPFRKIVATEFRLRYVVFTSGASTVDSQEGIINQIDIFLHGTTTAVGCARRYPCGQ